MQTSRTNRTQQPKEFEEKVIEVKRISKKTKGGNKINFSALVVIGDNKGRAGVGLSKAKDVLSSIQKSIRRAKRNLISIDLVDGTIPHQIMYKRGAAIIFMKPAREGTGVIAGGAVRAVVEAFGVRNIVSKCMGTANKASNVYATFEALSQLQKVKKNDKAEQKVEDQTGKVTIKPIEAKKVSAKPVGEKKPIVTNKPSKTVKSNKTKKA